MQLSFGERNRVEFNSKSAFFESLGYLCNNKRGIYFSSETSENRWGAELRIWITDASNMPTALKNADSMGLGNYKRRVNCNEYIYHIISNFGFTNGNYQNCQNIRRIVASEYAPFLSDFDKGYNL